MTEFISPHSPEVLTVRMATSREDKHAVEELRSRFPGWGLKLGRSPLPGDEVLVAFQGDELIASVRVNLALTCDELDKQAGMSIDDPVKGFPALVVELTCSRLSVNAFDSLIHLILKQALGMGVDGQPVACIFLVNPAIHMVSMFCHTLSQIASASHVRYQALPNRNFMKHLARMKSQELRGELFSTRWEGELPFRKYRQL